MYKKILYLFLCIQICIILTPVITAAASDSSPSIRVGYVPDDTFFYQDSFGQYQGLYAEYLFNISQYTNWKYDFISGSLEKLLVMLAEGDIDMLINVNYTPERRAICYFPDYPVTVQQLCCVVHPNDKNFPNSGLHNLDGQKIGTIADTYSESVLLKMIKDKNLKCTYCPYSNYTNLLYAFTAGSVDAIILNISDVDDSQQILSIIDMNEMYLAVSKLRPGILQELNNTLQKIHLQYPHYNLYLFEKYLDTAGKIYSFNASSIEYIENKPVLKVVYVKDNIPFEYVKEGENSLGGIAGAYFSSISQKSGLQFEFISSDNYSEALNMLKEKKADLISSMYSDIVFAKSHSLNLTDAYYNLGLSFIRKNNEIFNPRESVTIALPETSIGLDTYLLKSYPNMRFKYYSDMAKCIDSVRSDKTDAALLPSETASSFLQQHFYSDIVTSNGLQLNIPISIGIREDLPIDLMTILNQSLKSIPVSEKEDIQLENMVQTTYSVPLQNILAANIVPLLIFIFCSVTLIIVVIIFHSKKRYDKVLFVSKTDQLTGILNKISAETCIRSYLDAKPSELCALYILDIDRFKSINDTYGHKCGDVIIKDAAQLVNRTFAKHDIVGRMGGDEFIVLQTNCGSLDAIETKAKILHTLLNRTYHISSKQQFELSTSIGVMIYDNGNYTYDELVEYADRTLYQVKKDGRNSYKISK